jgi:diguanylate cyclase (GGDEF)-like protein
MTAGRGFVRSPHGNAPEVTQGARKVTQGSGRSPDPLAVPERAHEPFRSAAEATAAVVAAMADPRVRGAEISLEGVDVPELVGRLLATTRELERRLHIAEREAVLDPLTGLGNRRQWRSALRAAEERCRRGAADVVVAVIDLDGFKEINDRHGHAAGDALLRRLAITLSAEVRAGDTIARTGGDEFAVLAFGTDDARTLATRLTTALAAAGIEASVGAASRASTGSLEEAWVAADEAMYRAKMRRAA